MKTVEVLAQRYTLNDAERCGVLRHLIAQAHLSGYGLVNAVTHFSQEVEDYDRATELQALGGKLIELMHPGVKGLAERLEPRAGRGSGGASPRCLLRRDASELMRTWSRTRAPCPPLTHSSADSEGLRMAKRPGQWWQVPPAVAPPWSGHLC